MRKNKMTETSTMDELYHVVLSIDSQTTLRAFLEDLLTPTERQAISDRWQAAQRLNQGMTQREVAQELGLSVATVTRVARSLANQHGGYNALLKKNMTH